MEKSNMIVYTTSSTDQGFGNLQQLYDTPKRKLSYELKVTGLAFFLTVSPISANAYNEKNEGASFVKESIERVECYPSSIRTISVGNNPVHIQVRASTAWWNRQETFRLLFDSFNDNFNNGQQDIGDFLPLFKSLAVPLSQLSIKDVFVDVSRKKKLIDFNLSLEKGIFLSVAKRTDEQSDDVMFAIARNHQTMVIDEMPMSELMPKVSEVMTELQTL